jgi:pilus assembly protein FimV
MGKMTPNAPKLSKLQSLSAAVFIAWSLPSHALTLGRFQAQSAMGEPLRAEVEIAQYSPDELRGLQAQLASPSSFQQAGMEFNSALNGVTTRIENRGDGRPVIVLTGRSPIQDSFIDLILEAKTTTSKVVKNYALLLNAAAPASSARSPVPSVQSTPQPEVISTPVAVAPAATSVEKLSPRSVEVNSDQVPVYRFDTPPTTTATTRPPVNGQAPVPVALAVVSPIAMDRINHAHGDEDSLQVNPGDTISNLVMGRLPTGVSLDQMMLAMVRTNPHAFIEGNINLVRSGTVLRMPSAIEATQISRAQARETVLSQNRDFAAYARRVAESPILVGSAQSREMSGNVGQPEPNAPASGSKQDKLTLSKAQVSNNNEEAKLAADRESKDATAQLDALKKNMDDLEALAKNKPNDATVTLPSTTQDGLLEQLGQNKSMWALALGALLALFSVVVWSRRDGKKTQAVYAPSYDDIPSPLMPDTEPVTRVPPEMANINLDLPTVVEPKVPTPTPAINTEADQNKLNLAGQLIANGEKDLARTLIMSVASTASGDLKARALQMLGQIA